LYNIVPAMPGSRSSVRHNFYTYRALATRMWNDLPADSTILFLLQRCLKLSFNCMLYHLQLSVVDV